MLKKIGCAYIIKRCAYIWLCRCAYITKTLCLHYNCRHNV